MGAVSGMNAKDLETIYNANATIGHLEGIEGVFLTAYYLGQGIQKAQWIHAKGVMARIPMPDVIVKFVRA